MPRLLIVDDEPAVLKLIAREATAAGYEVVAALGAEPAIEACRTQTFDVLVSDVNMPAMDGHELVCWLTSRHPAMRPILMSALGPAKECEICPIRKGCDLITKPFRSGELLESIRRVLAAPR